MNERRADHPEAAVQPPRFYAAVLILGLLCEYFWRRPMLEPNDGAVLWFYLAGAILIAFGTTLIVWAMRLFKAAGTPIPVKLPTETIVMSGPYRFSRNPIYVALTAIYLGIGLAADSQWIFALAIPMLAIMRFGVIAREELYLEAKFGGAYLTYKNRVRRWI